jgi:hypothetical protein
MFKHILTFKIGLDIINDLFHIIIIYSTYNKKMFSKQSILMTGFFVMLMLIGNVTSHSSTHNAR